MITKQLGMASSREVSNNPKCSVAFLGTVDRRFEQARSSESSRPPTRSRLEDFEVEVQPINLSLGRRLSDALERWNAIDRVELLNGLRINITAPERCEALLGELR